MNTNTSLNSDSSKGMSEKRPKMEKIDTMDDALKVLEQIAASSSQELKDIIRKDYHALKRIFDELTPDVKTEVENITGKLKSLIHDSEEKIKKVTKDTVDSVDSKVHEKPWFFLMGVFALASILGFVFGNQNKK